MAPRFAAHSTNRSCSSGIFCLTVTDGMGGSEGWGGERGRGGAGGRIAGGSGGGAGGRIAGGSGGGACGESRGGACSACSPNAGGRGLHEFPNQIRGQRASTGHHRAKKIAIADHNDLLLRDGLGPRWGFSLCAVFLCVWSFVTEDCWGCRSHAAHQSVARGAPVGALPPPAVSAFLYMISGS
jgi:hypothetical protein